MASIFEDVTLSWKGQEFKVPANRVMGLVEVIEDVITLEELVSKSGGKRAKLARAFANAISYAGGNVSQEDVYTSLFGEDSSRAISAAVTSILSLMIPPEHIRGKSEKQKAAKPKKQRASSRKRT